MTGGGTGACLQTMETGGMGEGWSDALESSKVDLRAWRGLSPTTTTKLERLERVGVGLMARWNARPNGRRKFGVRWSAKKSSPSRNAAGKSNADESQDKERRFGCRCLAIKNKGLIDGGTRGGKSRETEPVLLPICSLDSYVPTFFVGLSETNDGSAMVVIERREWA
ncbi:hypothetical protein C8J57DRAFT_1475451 [Mycena rebaudengoi]|nr:hypothetical protein C8J57DRAFT_1475451 [Mycena rebaudengoi]